MNHKKFLTLVAATAFLLVGCGFLKTTEEDMKKADDMMTSNENLTSHYEEYTPNQFEKLHGNEKFALFFHADWCPSCRQLEKELKENMDVLNGHTVLEANYDEEKELKKTYDVTTQTTVLFFNMNGTVSETRIDPRLKHFETFFK